MTDRYTELVKQAYEAQQAREGSSYQALTAELAQIDADLEALAGKREQAVAALESMDDAVEAAKEALDAYFAGRDEDELFEDEKPFGYIENPDQAAERINDGDRAAGWNEYFKTSGYDPYEPADEFSTPRANGALTD